jgi:N-acetylglucosamine kinase-like BadF-type ATPase
LSEIYAIGVDGGGTGTSAVLSTKKGRIVAVGSGGPANFQVVGEEQTLRSIVAAISSALNQGNAPHVPEPEIAAIAVGLAGLHTPADKDRLTRLVANQYPASRIGLWTDADVALAATSGDRAGIVVIAGTGSIALGRDDRGNGGRCGGWGYLIGDEGSAYAIAREGLRVASQGLDGRMPPTSLAAAFVQALAVPGFDDLLRPLYGPPAMTRHQIAQLAPLVTQCALAGDAAARDVLAAAAGSLAAMVIALGSRLGFVDDAFPVACSGGVWQAGEAILEPFQRRVLAAFPRARVGPPALSPAAGAVFLAVKSLADGALQAAWTNLSDTRNTD